MKPMRVSTHSTGGSIETDHIWYVPESPFEEALLRYAVIAEMPKVVPIRCTDCDPCEWEADLVIPNLWQEGWLNGQLHISRVESHVATLADGPYLPIRFHVGEDPHAETPEGRVVVEWQIAIDGVTQQDHAPAVPYLREESVVPATAQHA